MSLLSSFVTTQLMAAIEHEFANHESEIQSAIISELQNFMGLCANWIESKVNAGIVPAVDAAVSPAPLDESM